MSEPATLKTWPDAGSQNHPLRLAICPSILALVLLAACASGRRAGPDTIESRRNTLTRAELSDIDTLETTYSVIMRLRPWFLNPRPGAFSARGQLPTIAVFVDGRPVGGTEALHGLPAALIEAIQLIPRSEADRVVGGGRGYDAMINVVLRRRPELRDVWIESSSSG